MINFKEYTHLVNMYLSAKDKIHQSMEQKLEQSGEIEQELAEEFEQKSNNKLAVYVELGKLLAIATKKVREENNWTEE
ncbi:MAG: hypothetical protein M9892_07510 [Bacteroidetes bacterium]|nr:hypothetical protein [Bacteroidota bacterium]